MSHYYAFNGDADGLCALHQLRLANPEAAQLITGIKRDVKLLDRVEAGAGDLVTALDISLDSNRASLMRLLEAGANINYFDHHYAGEIPRHRNLAAYIDSSPEVCTSILVDRHLQGRYHLWAIVAAFGDNIRQKGRAMGVAAGLANPQLDSLARLGEYLNYNAYGDSLEDIHFPPAELYEAIRPYSDPFVFIAESGAFDRLAAGFHDDSAKVDSLRPLLQRASYAVYLLPNASWARRINGIFANKLASGAPWRAHAVITPNRLDSCYMVSVRAPIVHPQGADVLCLKFDTGGGRKAAAGINLLPADALDRFLALFAEQFG